MRTKTKTAVILAAGDGKRLDVFETPKPLLKVNSVPLVVHTLNYLHSAGIKDIYIVIKKGDTVIQRELLNYPANITFIEQVSGKRGMLDSILSLKGNLKGPFFITVSDLILSKNPYRMFFKNLKSRDQLTTLISTNTLHNINAGATVKVLVRNNRVGGIGTRIPEYNAFDIGIYHFTKRGFEDLCAIAVKDKAISSVAQLFVMYNEKKGLASLVFDGEEWFDINTPKTFIRAELYLRNTLQEFKLAPSQKVLKKLSTTTTLSHTKQSVTDIIVRRNILDRLEEYEIIPPECYKSPHHLIVDSFIDKTLGNLVHQKLLSLGYQVYKHTIHPGEKAKSISGYVNLSNDILKRGLDKKSIVLSLGGGATKDMAGFLASTLYRGIGFISMPTTVLSQCDAAIAHKQGVNGTDGKNLLGSWYAPLKIIVDPAVLLTLNDRYISDGLAECIKQSLAYNKEFYRLFCNYNGDLKNIDFLETVVKKAIKLKVISIEQDLHENRIALVNQYGHEFGHAVEHLSGYKYGHGESVAIGMRVSAELSRILGICSGDVVDAHIDLLKKYRLPYQVPKNISPEDILNSLKYNKKYYSGEPRFVLVNAIGSVWHDKTYYTVSCKNEFIKEAIEKSYS